MALVCLLDDVLRVVVLRSCSIAFAWLFGRATRGGGYYYRSLLPVGRLVPVPLDFLGGVVSRGMIEAV